MNDIIIIGAGPGGYEAAAYAARQGLTVTIVEQDHVGGTCLNRGCIPTKALVHSAELVRLASTGAGTYANGVERKDTIVAQLRQGVETVLSQPGITLVRGRARLAAPTAEGHTVVVGDQTLHARHVIIATGSHAKLPPVDGIDDRTVVTSDSLLDLKQLPQRLCIIGAGVIGMEFASIYASWGVSVTVVEYLKECLPMIDSDIAKRLRKALERRGVDFIMQAAVTAIHDGTVSYQRKGRADATSADLVLVATGRAANTAGLGLEDAGVETGPRGITVDDNMQTTAPGIYAIGDCNGRTMLAHAATFQGYRAVNAIVAARQSGGNALTAAPDNLRLDVMPSAVFTWPEAAAVGLSEDGARQQGMAVLTGKAFHRANGKALTIGETEGMVKLITATDGTLLGCHAYGAHAADIVQEATALITARASLSQLQATVHIHPTVGELLHQAAMSIRLVEGTR